jgi:hypothetical protein
MKVLQNEEGITLLTILNIFESVTPFIIFDCEIYVITFKCVIVNNVYYHSYRKEWKNCTLGHVTFEHLDNMDY